MPVAEKWLPGNARKFSDNSRRISFYVFNSPKSTSRRGLRLPKVAEIADNAFKRALGAKKRKSRKGHRADASGRDRFLREFVSMGTIWWREL